MCSHNPEVVGSSPASATIKVLKSYDFRTFYCTLQPIKLYVIISINRFDPNLTPIGFLKSSENILKFGEFRTAFLSPCVCRVLKVLCS